MAVLLSLWHSSMVVRLLMQDAGAHSSVQAPTLFTLPLATNPSSQSNTPSGVSTAAHNFQLTFKDNTPGSTFTLLATTNLSVNNWNVLGQPIQIGPGLFQFTDFQATNNPQRFYRVSS